MVNEPILERLPPLMQDETRRDQNRVEFDQDIDVYTLPNAPVIEVREIRDDGTTYVEDTDYELLTNANGRVNRVDWSFGGRSPDHGTDFIVDAVFKTIVERYATAHDEEFEFVQEEIDDVIEGRQLENADIDELEEIGALFGALGRRRGRSKSDYKAYLRSIVDSFSGRGSVSGLKFAIASAIGKSPENVKIIENFSELEYTVEIVNVDTSLITSAINDLAELADPSVVVLDQAIIIIDEGGVTVDTQDSEFVSQRAGLGSQELTLDGETRLNGRIVDNFEDGDLAEYSGDTGGFAVTSTVVQEGSNSLEVTAGTSPDISSTSGLANYVDGAGESFAVDMYIPSSTTAYPQIQWRMPDANNGYAFGLSPSDDELQVWRKDSGSFTSLKTVTEPNLSFDTWYRVEVYTDVTDYSIVIYEQGAAVPREQITFSDSTHTGEGVGFRENNGDFPCYFDNMRLI